MFKLSNGKEFSRLVITSFGTLWGISLNPVTGSIPLS